MYKRYSVVSFSRDAILDLPNCIKKLKPNDQIIFRQQQGSLEDQGRIFCIVWATKESITYYFQTKDKFINRTIYIDYPFESVINQIAYNIQIKELLNLIKEVTFPYYVEVFSDELETDKDHPLA